MTAGRSQPAGGAGRGRESIPDFNLRSVSPLQGDPQLNCEEQRLFCKVGATGPFLPDVKSGPPRGAFPG